MFKSHFSVLQNLGTESGFSRPRLPSLLPLSMFRLLHASLLATRSPSVVRRADFFRSDAEF